MAIPFSHWPADLAARYREKGYWADLPLYDILAKRAGSEALAIIDGSNHWRYCDLDRTVNHLACALQRRGLKQGDTALVQLGNSAEFCITFFALLKIGVVPVNALYSHQRMELEAYASQIEPKLIVADRHHGLFANDEFSTLMRARYPGLRVVLQHDGGVDGLAALINERIDYFVPRPTPPGEVAFFQLSGGSTGTPKLIPRTHNDYYYSIRRSVEICRFDEHTRFLCAIPAAHNYAMSSPGWLGAFYGGGCLVLAADPSPTCCFPIIACEKVTHAALVPPALSLWLQALQDGADKSLLASLQLLQVGGARLSESLARRIPDEMGCQLQQVFGMAEGLVNYTRLDDSPERIFTTQGAPMCPDDEVWVADENGQRLAPGEEGRLMTRGPYTFRGYYRSPDHNASAFDDEGFYCSGDLIVMDEQGYIRVVGREKDQINRGGEKIAAEEIENLLLRHEAVLHAALVSMEDELLGEKSCAFIVAHRPLRPVEVRRYLRELGIAEFKLPDRVEMVNDLPLTHVGKVDKKRLRQLIAEKRLALI